MKLLEAVISDSKNSILFVNLSIESPGVLRELYVMIF